MNQLPEAFTLGDITYNLPVTITNLTELKIVQTIGDHGKIFLKGIAPDTLEPTDVERVAPKSKIEINLPGRTTPYFAGVCTNISMTYQAGLKTIEIEGRSWTCEFDIVKKSRSYQKLNISYDELIQDVLKDYAQKDYRVVIPDNKKYMRFAVQYQETDWEFLKRIAAREGTVLVAEYADQNHQPRFWLGLPKFSPKPFTANADKITSRDNGKYLDIACNYDDAVKETDFITYETTGYQTLHVGETVDYAGKELTIINSVSQLDKGLLKNTYTLAFSEKIALAVQLENTKLKSLALSGKVLERSGINIKIHLDIDDRQDKATAIWFPYAADTDNFMYCMPHEGEVVNLYFRDGWEDDAIAISGVRGNGQTCQKTGDYNHRYFTTHERKELYLSPDTLSFTADENAASKITIKMTEQDGIAIASAKDIVLGATGNIEIKGKTISVAAGSVSDMAAGALGAIPGANPSATQPGLYINTGLASIVLKDNKANFYGKPVKVEGRNKAPCPQPEQVPADEEEEGMSALDWLQVGLTVASFIPVIGTPAALLDAGISAARGDYAGAALSVATAVPFAGSVAAAGKIAKSSKIAARISKTLKAGKKITKVSKMIKPRCFALGKGVTRTVKFSADKGKIIRETAEAIAKKTGRLIPGKPGVVTGGNSTTLGKNMMEAMGLKRSTKWSGYQAQHIIPSEMANSAVIKKIGMNLDDASNGIFLRIPDKGISPMSRHQGYHSVYNQVVEKQLKKMDINQSIDVLEKKVYDLQQNLKHLQNQGLPLYPNQGATVELWERQLGNLMK